MAVPLSYTRVPEFPLCAEKHINVTKEERGRRNSTSRESTAMRATGREQGLPSLTSNTRASAPKQSFLKQEQKSRHSLHGTQEKTTLNKLASTKRGENVDEELEHNSLVKLAPVQNQTRRRIEVRHTILSDYGIQENREIPKHLSVNFLSEIVKIERQLREEKILMEIRKSREMYDIKKHDALREVVKLSSRTALPGFSYFPNMPGHVGRPGLQQDPKEAEVNKRRVRLHQEKTVKKMGLFYQRYSHKGEGKRSGTSRRY